MRRALLTSMLALAGCRHAPPLPDDVKAKLAASPGAYLTGKVLELRDPQLLNNEDFVYDAKPSPSSKSVAVSRLGAKTYQLTLWALEAGDEGAPKQLADVSVNPYEFDVDSLEWSPDGAMLAAVSRDGSVRAFDAATGKLQNAWLTEEPLVSLAFHPSGRYVVVGSSKGLVTTLTFPGLGFIAEQRVHQDEVRALAFAKDGRLFTGSWDRSIAVLASSETPVPTDQARVRFERKGGQPTLRGILAGKASATFAIDARLPASVVVRSALATTSGIGGLELKEEVSLPSALGTVVAKIAKGQRLSFKGLVLPDVDVAICEACVPEGSQAVLGQQFLDQVDLQFDEAAKEAVLKRKGALAEVGPSGNGLSLVESARFTFQGAVNDFSLDRAGKTLGVALSETKSERTREVYEREKKGQLEPVREWDCAAFVDASNGQVLTKVQGHHGVVATVALSPDGTTLASGGWDKRVLVHRAGEPVERRYGWAVRRVRFSPDGRWLVVAAWTPQNAVGDHKSDVSAAAYEVSRESPTVVLPE